MRHKLDPAMVTVMTLLEEADSLIESGRIAEGQRVLHRAREEIAKIMDIELDDWEAQSEFLP